MAYYVLVYIDFMSTNNNDSQKKKLYDYENKAKHSNETISIIKNSLI